MSTKGVTVVPNAIVRDGIIPLNERVVLITLASHAGSEKVCRVLRSTLVREVGISRASITRALRWLSDAGYVSIRHNKNGQSLASSTYRLNLEVYQDITVDEDLPEEPEGEAHTEPTPGSQGANPRLSVIPPRLTQSPPPAHTEPVKEKNLSKRTLENAPSENPSPPSVSTSPAVALSREENHKRFEMFWDAFPKSRNKAETEKLYAAAVHSGLSHEFLLDKAKGYARQAAQEPPERKQFIASSVTWLTDGRWKETTYPPEPKKLNRWQRPVAE